MLIFRKFGLVLLSMMLFLAGCASPEAFLKQNISAYAKSQEVSYFHSPYIKDLLFLESGCVIHLSRISTYPVYIYNYTTKESVVLLSMPENGEYEIEKSGDYLVFCVKDEEIDCINDDLVIDYISPETGAEFRLLDA